MKMRPWKTIFLYNQVVVHSKQFLVLNLLKNHTRQTKLILSPEPYVLNCALFLPRFPKTKYAFMECGVAFAVRWDFYDPSPLMLPRSIRFPNRVAPCSCGAPREPELLDRSLPLGGSKLPKDPGLEELSIHWGHSRLKELATLPIRMVWG